tara:strand:+ start:861 stop:1070 length:210 start_codon:yes stop_codon:yes gene_type:complete
MENKCIICLEKKESSMVSVKEWIIDGKSEAIAGEDLHIHAECLSNELCIERPEGFMYGRITLGTENEKS